MFPQHGLNYDRKTNSKIKIFKQKHIQINQRMFSIGINFYPQGQTQVEVDVAVFDLEFDTVAEEETVAVVKETGEEDK